MWGKKGRRDRGLRPRSLVPTEDASDLGGGVGVADWRSRPRIDRGFQVKGPRLIQDRGHQSVTPTPPPRSPASSVGIGDLGGGVGVVDWRPQSQIDRGPLTWNPRSIRGQGLQSATPTPPPRSRASSVGTSDLGGGVGVSDWQPQPLFPSRFSFRTKIK
ncbi:hypothetical protein CRG98_015777 [Punica granatum]|uniref:Uncharacterized protein n=1 Tax=Punica granatum TaxID=22663 RepID=A0A2I0K6Q9_PUNGR|nr:hypothetical protein CRG98_015777 [Punica granatum]